jgi:hypothetical protein
MNSCLDNFSLGFSYGYNVNNLIGFKTGNTMFMCGVGNIGSLKLQNNCFETLEIYATVNLSPLQLFVLLADRVTPALEGIRASCSSGSEVASVKKIKSPIFNNENNVVVSDIISRFTQFPTIHC